MKNQILIALTLSIILFGCTNSSQLPSAITQNACDEVKDREVFKQTANIWVYSWINVLNEIYSEGEVAQHSSDYLTKRSFDPSQVLDYLNTCEECQECEGCEECKYVRIYFVDLHDISNKLWMVNDLMLVNVKDCKDQIGEDFLVADSSESYYVNKDQAKDATKRMVENSSPSVGSPFIKRVYAYTFERCTIYDFAKKAQELNKKIDFKFAIHDMSPSGSTTPNIMNTQGLLGVDLLLGIDSLPETKLADFARPCPELCGTGSPFFYLELQE